MRVQLKCLIINLILIGLPTLLTNDIEYNVYLGSK